MSLPFHKLTPVLFMFAVFGYVSICNALTNGNYIMSDVRMEYSDADSFCRSAGCKVADVSSSERDTVGKFIFTYKSGPNAVWSTYEGMESVDDNRGTAVSVHCQDMATPGTYAKSDKLYALCEKHQF